MLLVESKNWGRMRYSVKVKMEEPRFCRCFFRTLLLGSEYLELFERSISPFSFPFSPCLENSLQKDIARLAADQSCGILFNWVTKAGFVSVQLLVAGPYGNALMNSSSPSLSLLDWALTTCIKIGNIQVKHQEERKFGLFPWLSFSEVHMQEQYSVCCFCPVVFVLL